MCDNEIEEQNKDVIQRYWYGKWNERRPEILDELQMPDVQYHSSSMQLNGVEEYKQAYGMFLSAFHDTKITIEDMIAEDDKVITQVTMHGVHRGEFEDIPPTGKSISISGFTLYRLVDGKIAEEWESLDELGMMTQLGMELRPKAE